MCILTILRLNNARTSSCTLFKLYEAGCEKGPSGIDQIFVECSCCPIDQISRFIVPMNPTFFGEPTSESHKNRGPGPAPEGKKNVSFQQKYAEITSVDV